MSVKVLKQDHHRNGISGAGFVISLVEWTEEDIDKDQNPFVAISFEIGSRNDFIEHTAVVSVPLLSQGVVEFFQNSWRGADYVGPAVADAWQERCLNNKLYAYDPFKES